LGNKKPKSSYQRKREKTVGKDRQSKEEIKEVLRKGNIFKESYHFYNKP
jgi:hypothetical protein